jgi:hypothetical protein
MKQSDGIKTADSLMITGKTLDTIDTDISMHAVLVSRPPFSKADTSIGRLDMFTDKATDVNIIDWTHASCGNLTDQVTASGCMKRWFNWVHSSLYI